MELHNFVWLVAALFFSAIQEGMHSVHRESYNSWDLFLQPLLQPSEYQALEIIPLKKENEDASTRPHGRRTIYVKCHEDSLAIVVQADLFGIGVDVDSDHLHLGSESMDLKGVDSPCRAVSSGAAEFTIHAHLKACGTKLSSRDNLLVYSNVLVYLPEIPLGGVQRLNEVVIPIECQYEKRCSVGSAPMRPTWSSFVAKMPIVDQLHFSLKLMTDDWYSLRGSSVYFLGDPIHLEAAVVLGDHMPFRVYVDHCFAMATPYSESTLRYDFIDRNGCLADAKVTGSSSRFLPRVKDDKLRFTVEAFRFYQQNANLIYITCHLKAVPAFSVVRSNRACSFIDNRWQSLDGSDHLCRRCDLSQRLEEPQSTATTTQVTAAITHSYTPEPIVNPKRSEHGLAKHFRVRQNWSISKSSAKRAQPRAPAPSPYNAVVKRGTKSEQGWSKIAHLGPLVVLPAREVAVTRLSSTEDIVTSTVLSRPVNDASMPPAEQPGVLTELEVSTVNLTEALSMPLSEQAIILTVVLDTALHGNGTSLMSESGVTENVTEVSQYNIV